MADEDDTTASSDSSDANGSGDSSSSSETGTAGDTTIPLSEDDVAGALVTALQNSNVGVDDDGVKVSTRSGLYHLAVRLSATAEALPQVPDDTDNLPPRSVQPAALLLLGTVQIIGDRTRVTMRIVLVETSEIKESSRGDASGGDATAVETAAVSAISKLPTLNP
jgi:hypothetical protein